MTPEFKFGLFQLAILLPFIAGSYLNHRFGSLEVFNKKLVILSLTFLEPPIILWSIMGLSPSREMIFLPVAGIVLATSGFFLGKLFVFLSGMKTNVRLFVISSALANQGFTLGGFLCYLFAGEKGLALSGIFLIYFVPFTFLFIFGYASMEHRQLMTSWSSVRSFLINLRNLPLLAILLAIVLRLMGLERPKLDFPLNTLVIIAVSIYYFTLGANFKLGDLNPFRRENLFLAIQKFILLPALAFLLIHFLPISDDLKLIIKIESFMPVAIFSVIAAIMFNLDSRKASGMFVVNSLVFLFLVFPLLFYFRQVLL